MPSIYWSQIAFILEVNSSFIISFLYSNSFLSWDITVNKLIYILLVKVLMITILVWIYKANLKWNSNNYQLKLA